ncbi:glycosyltransferase family 9 protein [Polaromonas sp. UC242_47]|uniref:glycosyltransferase family 9 protein n=1 Tax=Polaromonas sp. UC242_47 TaxID=3374626 RepID=UPI0037B0D755
MLKKLTSALDGRLKQLALATTTPQLTKPIGTASPQQYIAEAGYQKVGWRAWRRSLVFMASGQANVKINSLENAGKRGLWLYAGEGQVGDALMDLAPRSLLQGQGFHMDLLTDPHLARLFQDDPWFASVTDDASVLAAVPYDFVIVLSHKRRSLQPKSKHFKKLPWVSILENFTGPNFDRSGYATQRLADLLGLELSPTEFTEHARQKLKPRLAPAGFEQETAHLGKAVALSIGGVDPLRTYSAWPQVMSALMCHGIHEFLLIGSDNGLADAQRIEQELGASARIHNYVGKCSLAQSHDLLAAARVAVCTDGGLMHLAATTATPVLGLFSAAIQPEWRLHPRPGIAFVCSNSADVNDASVQEIVEKTLLLCHAPPPAQTS